MSYSKAIFSHLLMMTRQDLRGDFVTSTPAIRVWNSYCAQLLQETSISG